MNPSTDNSPISLSGQDDPDAVEMPGQQAAQPSPAQPPSSKRTRAAIAKVPHSRFYNYVMNKSQPEEQPQEQEEEANKKRQTRSTSTCDSLSGGIPYNTSLRKAVSTIGASKSSSSFAGKIRVSKSQSLSASSDESVAHLPDDIQINIGYDFSFSCANTSYYFFLNHFSHKFALYSARATLLEPPPSSDPALSEPVVQEASAQGPTISEPTAMEVEPQAPTPPSPAIGTNNPASPAKSATNSPNTVTKDTEEVQVLGSRKVIQDGPSTTIARIVEPEVKTEAGNRGKDPVIYSGMPALDSLELPALLSKYFSRVSQHRGIEDSFISTIQKRHEVISLTSLNILMQ